MSIEATVLGSSSSDFYRTFWGTLPPGTPREKLPSLTRSAYALAPFLKRLYRTTNLLTKVAYHDEKPFLIGRHLDDIGTESYGAIGNRPLVAFSSVHESLEKSLWCYSKNILPLISDVDLDITAMLARRYEADSLFTDSITLTKLLPSLAEHYELGRFQSVSIVDTAFNLSLAKKVFPKANTSLILGLPETGGIATSCPDALVEGKIVFHPAPHRHIEETDELTVTDDRLLPTPLIRYRPGLQIRPLKISCACKSDFSFEPCPI